MNICSTCELQVLWSRKWTYSWIFLCKLSCYLFTVANLIPRTKCHGPILPVCWIINYEMFSFTCRTKRSNFKFYTCKDAESSLSLEKDRSSVKKHDRSSSADTVGTALWWHSRRNCMNAALGCSRKCKLTTALPISWRYERMNVLFKCHLQN